MTPQTTIIAYVLTSEERSTVELKVSQIGSLLGVILPKEVITQLRVNKGDALWLVEGPNG